MYKTKPTMTGGCQCGAVRYALFEMPELTICHCRMCQKAVGGPFAALCKVPTVPVRLDPRRTGQLQQFIGRRTPFLLGLRHAADIPLPRRRCDRGHHRQPGRSRQSAANKEFRR